MYKNKQMKKHTKWLSLLAILMCFIPSNLGIHTSLYATSINYSLQQCALDAAQAQNMPITELRSLTCAFISTFGDLSDLENLQQLTLTQVKTTQFPQDFTKLHKLRSLTIQDSNLTEIPAVFFDLTQLQQLAIINSKVQSISPHIKLLTGLTDLNLSGNSIQSVPSAVFDLNYLTNLHLQSNELIALPTIPSQKTFQVFDVSHNQITVLPSFEQVTLIQPNFSFNPLQTNRVQSNGKEIIVQDILTLTPIHFGTSFTVRNNWRSLSRDLASTFIYSNGNKPLLIGTYSLTNVRDLQGNPIALSTYLQQNMNIIANGSIRAQVQFTLPGMPPIISPETIFVQFISSNGPPTLPPIVQPENPDLVAPPQTGSNFSEASNVTIHTQLAEQNSAGTDPITDLQANHTPGNNNWFQSLTPIIQTEDDPWIIYQIIQFIIISVLIGLLALSPLLAAYGIIRLLKYIYDSGDKIFYTKGEDMHD